MGITIDDKIIKQLSNSIKVLQKANSGIAEAYDKSKADYENRLKADMVAMLNKLYADIQKLRGCSCSCSDGIIDDIEDIIDKYKAESEDKK